MEQSEIIAKINKVKALAERGDAGERESAQLILDRLIKQYGISVDDIDKPEPRKWFYAHIEGYQCKALLVQICAQYPDWRNGEEGIWISYIPDMPYYKQASIKKWLKENLIFNCNTIINATRAEFLEIMASYTIYQRVLTKQEEAFFFAFLMRNELLLEPKTKKDKEVSAEDLEMLAAAMRMAPGIEKAERHKLLDTTNKLIEQ